MRTCRAERRPDCCKGPGLTLAASAIRAAGCRVLRADRLEPCVLPCSASGSASASA